MSTHEEDLDLLLSLQDRVLETPPASPSSIPHQTIGCSSDDGFPKRTRKADMSVFRDAVKDYLIDEPDASKPLPKSKRPKRADINNNIDVEKFSGLRIRDQYASAVQISNRFSDTRFIRLPAIRNLLDSVDGCWATVGVLIEKGTPKTSSAGKVYGVWKMGCLDESSVSVFLFGDAYGNNLNEPVGTVFALFNSNVRNADGGFSLSVYSAAQILKMGTSVDYGVCKGKRKDGMPCTMVIDKSKKALCKYHISTASQRYTTTRAELKGGNLRNAFRLQSEGIYMNAPLQNRSNTPKSMQAVKVMSVDGLKKALSNASQVTTKSQSQGIRFLREVTEDKHAKDSSKEPTKRDKQHSKSNPRFSSSMKMASKIVIKSQLPAEMKKKTEPSKENLIELDLVSSDEEG